MTILGLSCFYHDASACILRDGQIVAAAAEERFTRIKHDHSFPEQAIRFCLDWTHVDASEIDAVAFYEKPIRKFSRMLYQHLHSFPKSRKTFIDTMGSWMSFKLDVARLIRKRFGYSGSIAYVPHHFSHAAGAYYTSPFTESAIVTVDGVGEFATTAIGTGRDARIRMDREIRFPHSLGLLYSALTAYLGFEVNDAEYKVMGLAAYGNPDRFRDTFNALIRSFPDGSFALNMEYFDFVWSDRMFSVKLERLLGQPSRKPESRMAEVYADIAAGLQTTLEDTVISLLNAVYDTYRIPYLCFGGGVALNSVLNGKILDRTPFSDIHILPDPGDGGGSVGAALALWHKGRQHKQKPSFQPFLGPAYADEYIRDALMLSGLNYTYYENPARLIDETVRLLAKRKVIGWFQGRMEWGPRALGNRSILAAADTARMRDIINTKIKHREPFRPFAPVILKQHVRRYFRLKSRLPDGSKYMLMVYPFRDPEHTTIPAVVHVDGSGRLQSLTRSDNPLYYDLIAAFAKKTGVPVLINTSFNVRGEPIVCTPRDAIQCYLRTDIDCLVIGNCLVTKNRP